MSTGVLDEHVASIFLLDLLFDPEDGGNIFLQNVSSF
jgi:hypothetical protein